MHGEVLASELCSLCQFWGHTGLGLHRAAVPGGLALLSLPTPGGAWMIPSKYSGSPSWQRSQTILWSFSLPPIFTRQKMSSWISQMRNERCSWCSVCLVYNYWRLCRRGNVLTFASLVVPCRLVSDIQLGTKTMYVMSVFSQIREQWEESWEGYPSAWAVSPDTSLLASAVCPSNDTARARVLQWSFFFMLRSLTARLHNFFSKKNCQQKTQNWGH